MLNQLTVNNLQNPTASPTNSLTFFFFKKNGLGVKNNKHKSLKKKKKRVLGNKPRAFAHRFLNKDVLG